MITSNYIRPIDMPQLTANVLRSGAEKLLDIQRGVLNSAYVRQSGDMDAKLSSNPIKINTTSDGVSMAIDYLFYIRFLDLKKTAKGKNKKRYAPIYNKYVFGFLMGYIYNNLRKGLSASVVRQLPTTVINVNL